MTKLYGLIGYPLKVSFSKGYFSAKFEREKLNNHIYELFPLADISEFPEFVKMHPDLCGLNVTIPHKKTVMQYLDGLDESASEAGAVNVIKFEIVGAGHASPLLIGYNSDVFGFEQSFLPFVKPHHRSALILGTGGAAAAVAAVLRKHKIAYEFVSRVSTSLNDRYNHTTPLQSNTLNYDDLHQNGFGDANILINTTPLGMTPNIDTCPDLPYEKITSDFLCYDLVYTPDEPLFLTKSKQQGAVIKNGLEMLHLQADRAWEIWNT